jgi:hypothetical protein
MDPGWAPGAQRFELVRLDEHGGQHKLAEAAADGSFHLAQGLSERWEGGDLLLVAYRDGRATDLALASPAKDPTARADVNMLLTAWQSWEDLYPVISDGTTVKRTPVTYEKSPRGWMRRIGQVYSLARTPSKLVTFNPSVSSLWPGALVQGRSAAGQGVLDPLSITERAPVEVSVPELGATRIVAASVGTVSQAIQDMVRDKEPGSGAVSYTMREARSVEEAALEMGLSAHYMGFSASASLNVDKREGWHTVLACFEERAFTATFSAPTSPNDWFTERFTNAALDYLITSGSMGDDNPPLYVDSVTYGRLLLFTCSSTSSATEISAALKASYEGVVGGGEGKIDAKYKTILETSEVKVLALGGSTKNAFDLIKSSKIADYFSTRPKMQEYGPMSFRLSQLVNNRLARLSETTTYIEYQNTLELDPFTFTVEILKVTLTPIKRAMDNMVLERLEVEIPDSSVSTVLASATQELQELGGGWEANFPQGACKATSSWSIQSRDLPDNVWLRLDAELYGSFKSPEEGFEGFGLPVGGIWIQPDIDAMIGKRSYEVDISNLIVWSGRSMGEVIMHYRVTMIQPSSAEWPELTSH